MGRKKRVDFNSYYEDLFGGRWEELKSALAEPGSHVELKLGLTQPYFLDAASLVPVEALEPETGSSFLDLCAAPGGKALAIAGRAAADAHITANDRSSNRRARLHRVLQEHLEPEIAGRIRVTGHDAARWGLYEQDVYDRVLADVPCSSERHLIQEPKHLENWSPSRTKHLAIQAYAILAAGFTALRPGGILVYSTCSLSPEENDQVAGKLLHRQKGAARLLPVETSNTAYPAGEPTSFGRIILPDLESGWGPIYCARFTKVSG